MVFCQVAARVGSFGEFGSLQIMEKGLIATQLLGLLWIPFSALQFELGMLDKGLQQMGCVTKGVHRIFMFFLVHKSNTFYLMSGHM